MHGSITCQAQTRENSYTLPSVHRPPLKRYLQWLQQPLRIGQSFPLSQSLMPLNTVFSIPPASPALTSISHQIFIFYTLIINIGFKPAATNRPLNTIRTELEFPPGLRPAEPRTVSIHHVPAARAQPHERSCTLIRTPVISSQQVERPAERQTSSPCTD